MTYNVDFTKEELDLIHFALYVLHGEMDMPEALDMRAKIDGIIRKGQQC